MRTMATPTQGKAKRMGKDPQKLLIETGEHN